MRLVQPWRVKATRIVRNAFAPKLRSRTLANVVNGTPPVVREEVIRLRQYQEECIQSVLSYLENGQKRLGISLATGSGKTVIFTQLIDRVKPLNDNATQTLILAHRRELVEQAARHCENAYPDKSIEMEMAHTHATGVADITVASIGSLLSGDRLSKFDPSRFKLVLVDEAHHIVAPGYLQALEHFGLREPSEQSPALVGVSATFSRFDGLRLGSVIDHIVYHKDYVDMIDEGWLAKVMFTTIKSKADLSRVRMSSRGDFQAPQLSKAVNTARTNEITVQAWLSEAADRKSTLAFCVDVDHVTGLTSTFRQHGIDAQYITGKTKKVIRGERLDAFRKGQFPVLLNCGVFTEGTDVPNIDCILLARPTKSRNLLVQMIGRGMRLHPTKENCHVIDMVASLETGIVTVPTLFGLDPSELVQGASAADLRSLQARRIEESLAAIEEFRKYGSPLDAENVANTRLDITHYDSVHEMIEDTSGERHVRAISPNAWVQVDQDKYILTARGGVLVVEKADLIEQKARNPDAPVTSKSEAIPRGTLTKEPSVPTFQVTWKHTLPPIAKAKSPYSKVRTVATAPTLSDAVHAADTFAATKFERILIATSSDWRKTPASDGQIDFLNSVRIYDGQQPLTSETVTKGQAGDMITKIKFGARGRFDRIIGERKKLDRNNEHVEKLRRREEVKVGPLEA